MSKESTPLDLIVNTIKEKSIHKQDVYANSILTFKMLKSVLKAFAETLCSEVDSLDERISIDYTDVGDFEAHLRIAGDVLVFHMHTNVFQFDKSHSVWNTSYVKENDKRTYCGVINVYNFLNDSFKYHRDKDSGYMVSRLFVNSENHFLVQGKRQMGVLYNDFVNDFLDKDRLLQIIESIALYTLNFDLYVPPYDAVQEVSVQEMKQLSDSLQIKTAKRLGFKFQSDQEDFF